MDNPQCNPHCLQNPHTYYTTNYTRILNDDIPTTKYKRRVNDDKTLIKFGQLKLLLSEIEFLTLTFKKINQYKNIVVIYAGAAPGIHTCILINMFPFIEYVLVDPNKFKLGKVLYKSKVTLINKYFTNDLAYKLKYKYIDYKILFISDIRVIDIISEKDREKQIITDMNNQMEWYNILQPFKSMLKFHLPFSGANISQFKYLDGQIYFQAYEGKTSTETRLIVDQNAEIKIYDCFKYEDQLFKFNNDERTLCYKHDIFYKGIDHCYDCYTYIYILKEYIQLSQNNSHYKLKYKNIYKYIDYINKEINAKYKKCWVTYNSNCYNVNYFDYKYGVENIFNKQTQVECLT